MTQGLHDYMDRLQREADERWALLPQAARDEYRALEDRISRAEAPDFSQVDATCPFNV